jgi:cystathionine beta-lyase
MFKTINRDQTNAIKWERYKGKDLLPMWVADMDLASPEPIQNALIERAKHPVYGYTHPWTSLNESVVKWCKRQYDWEIDSDWLVWMPGVVPSFNLAVDIFGKGGRVLVQTPNYPPMRQAAERQGCQTVEMPVIWQDNNWQLNWDLLATEMSHVDCHLFLLCNPMNPNGAVLTKEDIDRLAELCNEHGVFLCSDEIHCDLILDGSRHTPASSVPALTDNSVTLMAASKTFNVAGLGCSFAIIPSAEVRKQWQSRMTDLIPHPNFMGLIAAEVAFTDCDEWHSGLLTHLKSNRDYLSQRLNQLEGLQYRAQPATFLAWIESTRDDLALDKHFINAGIMPSEGVYFGNKQHVRLNFGTGQETIYAAVEMLQDYWRQNTP